jgi:hypothetical protein
MNRIRRYILEVSMNITPEMKDWYQQRTNRHINLVRKYCQKLTKQYPELVDRGEIHDQSKFKNPEINPYILTTWRYRCKDKGIKFNVTPETEKEMSKATLHHIITNPHHPEYGKSQDINLLNNKDRDGILTKIVDATNMKDIDIAEMVADWCAMSEEKGNTPQEWADKNVNKRWKFTPKQVELIYNLMNRIWK